ncbi:recombinase family protein [Pseudomonas monteilii]|uniref:recombinase family protein n=1 Tax=Pseudomonas monteilii TaxID=76759 RepID=UPI001E3C31E9|nr:recombinase family protein [Pseudomonas monteilii]MCE1007827.1 recombinase family protein [Pseudomonas monteilii]
MSTAYAYIRYSSKAQGEAGRDSVDRQMTSIQAVTKQHGIELRPENIYSDTGVSGFDGSNSRKGKLKDLVDLILSEKIQVGDFVFVESIDRLSRQKMRLSKDLVYSILDRGVTLVTTIDGQIYSRARDGMEQDILLTVIAQRAHEESKTKSIRRRSAWNRAKSLADSEKAIFNGHNPPYGISYNKEENRFEIVEDEAKEINDIFESLKYVGVTLTIKKVNEYSKRKWTNRNIMQLFETKHVLGTYMSQSRNENKRKVFERYIENYYPQITSYELFDEAVRAMKSRAANRRYGGHTVGSLNIFRHVIKCDCCKASMLFEKSRNSKGITYPYFQCFTRKELKTGCDMPRFRFDYAFGLFLELIYQATTKDDFVPHPWQLLEDIEEENQDAIEAEDRALNFKDLLIKLLSNKDNDLKDSKRINSLNNSLLEQKSYKENLLKSFKSFTSGIIPKEFLEVVSSTDIKINETEAELFKLKADMNARATTLEIYSFQDVIELYKTEEGRLKINHFFTSNDITFNFILDKKSRTLFCKIYQHGFMIDKIARQFSLHNPLKEFGINNLNEYFNE